MSVFLFASIPLYSHLDWGGYLPTAVELARRGHRVVWAMEKGVIAGAIRRVGVEVAEVETLGWHWDWSQEPHDYSPEAWAAFRLRRNFDTWLPKDGAAAAAESLVKLARQIQARAIVSDPFVAAAALAAEALPLPYAIVGLPAVSPVERVWLPAEAEVLRDGLARLDRLCARFKITGRHFIQLQSGLWPHSPDLHISYFSESWYDRRDDVALPQNRFAGGVKTQPASPPPDWLAQLPAAAPLILITLGATFNYEPEFFQTAVKAVASLGAFPIVLTHDRDMTGALALLWPPDFALVRETVDYRHLMPRLTGIIHHGGPGTTHAAILHALPQVIVAPGPGQGTQAYLASRAGLGKFLHLQEATLENLRSLAASVFTNPSLKEAARRVQAEFAALPGIAGAADWLEEAAA